MSSKEPEDKLKTWMGNLTGYLEKKSATTHNNDKKELERWNMLIHKEKATQPINTTRESKPEGTGEIRNTQKISRQDKTVQTKHEKNFPISRERMDEVLSITG